MTKLESKLLLNKKYQKHLIRRLKDIEEEAISIRNILNEQNILNEEVKEKPLHLTKSWYCEMLNKFDKENLDNKLIKLYDDVKITKHTKTISRLSKADPVKFYEKNPLYRLIVDEQEKINGLGNWFKVIDLYEIIIREKKENIYMTPQIVSMFLQNLIKRGLISSAKFCGVSHGNIYTSKLDFVTFDNTAGVYVIKPESIPIKYAEEFRRSSNVEVKLFHIEQNNS